MQVIVQVIYGEIYKRYIVPGYEFRLQEGRRVVANGKVNDVVRVIIEHELVDGTQLHRIEG